MKKVSTIKFFVAALLGLAMLFSTLQVSAQNKQKAPKRTTKKMPEAILPETKIVARLTTDFFEIEPLKVRMHFVNPSGKRTTIGIRNYRNELVYRELFFGREYARNFNFETMLAGQYSFRIDNYKDHLNKRFAIQEIVSRKIATAEPVTYNNFAAIIYAPENIKVKLHLNNVPGKVVETVIRNEANEVVYKGYDSGKQIKKILDLEPLADGKYTLQVKNQNEKVVQKFEIASSREKAFVWTNKKGKPINLNNATAFIK